MLLLLLHNLHTPERLIPSGVLLNHMLHNLQCSLPSSLARQKKSRQSYMKRGGLQSTLQTQPSGTGEKRPHQSTHPKPGALSRLHQSLLQQRARLGSFLQARRGHAAGMHRGPCRTTSKEHAAHTAMGSAHPTSCCSAALWYWPHLV